MSSKPQKTPIFNSEKELANFLLSNVTDSLKQSIRVIVKIMIKEEMDNLRKEVDEHLSFNGYYGRHMTSPLGKIENIPIARFREKGNSDMSLRSIDVFEEQKDKFMELAVEMHRLGISTRKIGILCEKVLGVKISKNKVSHIHRKLAEEESFQINNIPLDDDFEYLYVDGIWAKAKSFGLKDNNKVVLLCVLGVKSNGDRKIIAFKIADVEDYESWNDMLLEVKERGLHGKNLKLIISDDNGGLMKAIKHLFPKTSIQTCMTHKMRNVISKAKRKNKSELAEDLKTIYLQQTKEEALKTMKQVARKWYLKEPKSVESLRFNFDKTLTYLNFPQNIWKQIRTTNMLEREFREVRRRIKVFDNSFNDRDSLHRYGNSIFSYLNNNYPAHLHTKA